MCILCVKRGVVAAFVAACVCCESKILEIIFCPYPEARPAR